MICHITWPEASTGRRAMPKRWGTAFLADQENHLMKLTKGLAALGAVLAGSLLATSLVATAAVADDSPASTTTTSTSSTSSDSDTSATPTVRMQQQNVVVTSITQASDTATATVTVRDPKRGDAVTIWNVSRTVKVDGAYKRFSDIRVGFRIHLAGPRTGTANPTADHIVVPGSNKKVLRLEMRKVTVLTVTDSAGKPTSMTVRTSSGGTFTWTLDNAKIQGGKHRDLSAGDTVSVRGQRLEGANSGAATIVKIDRDKKAKPAKQR